MRRIVAPLAAVALAVACSAYADYAVEKEGTWPATWPAELEPLRAQSRTLVGGQINVVFHEIPFTKRDDFEAAWPHLLKVKPEGAPLILTRGPDTTFANKITAGVRIKLPPKELPDRTDLANVQLIVDGDVVDLNRIPLPPDTPIIDERFKAADPARPAPRDRRPPGGN